MKRTGTLLAIATAVLALGAGAALAGRIVKVGQRSNGKTVILQPSDVLVVSLSGNATTGYAWRLRSVDKAVLRPVSVKYVPPKGGRIGAGGTYVLRFRALRVGSTRLRLIYARAGGSAARTYALIVIVKQLPPRV